MTLQQAIEARHSVRRYSDTPLPPDVVDALQAKASELNARGRLHIQLVQHEPKAFQGILAYGKFAGVTNYFVVAGQKGDNLDERIGYYGEQLVLFAQQLGLNTCWVGLSYSKVKTAYTLDSGEKIGCYIAVGYGLTQGVAHKTKMLAEVSNISDTTPQWFERGVRAALLAPTAVNQQKFRFDYIGDDKVSARRLFSMIGYTHMDLGIAKCHFEIGALPQKVRWV